MDELTKAEPALPSPAAEPCTTSIVTATLKRRHSRIVSKRLRQRPVSKSSTSRILTRSTAASHKSGTEVEEVESCDVPKDGQDDESTVSPESSVETGSQVTEVPQSKAAEPKLVEEQAVGVEKPDQRKSADSTLLDLSAIAANASTASKNFASVSNADVVSSSVIPSSPQSSPTLKVSSDVKTTSVFAPSMCPSVTSTPTASSMEPSQRDTALRDAGLKVSCSAGSVVASTSHGSISSYPDRAFSPSSSPTTFSVAASSSVCSKSIVGRKQLSMVTTKRRSISSQESGSKTLISLSSESHLCSVSDLFPSSTSLTKTAIAASFSTGLVSAALPGLTSTTPASTVHDPLSNLTAGSMGVASTVSPPVVRSSCSTVSTVTSPVISSICANNQTLLSHLKRPLTVSNSDQSLDLKRLKISPLLLSMAKTDSFRGQALSTMVKPAPSLKTEDVANLESLSSTAVSQTSPSVSATGNDSRHLQPQMSPFPALSGTLASTSPNSTMAFPRPAYSRSPDVVTSFFPRASTPSNHLSPIRVSTTNFNKFNKSSHNFRVLVLHFDAFEGSQKQQLEYRHANSSGGLL